VSGSGFLVSPGPVVGARGRAARATLDAALFRGDRDANSSRRVDRGRRKLESRRSLVRRAVGSAAFRGAPRPSVISRAA